jgi:hypothetical protein
MEIKTRETCRMDGSKLNTIFSLGEIYPSTFVKSGEGYNIEKVPLEICIGEKSELVQLRHTVSRDSLYKQYWYKSFLNQSMVNSLRDIVTSIGDRIALNPGDIVVDIGCNDGTMLSLFFDDLVTVGFDPALNLKDIASKNCDYFINDYFSSSIYPLSKKAKVITSIAMFYDLEYPGKFIEDISKILDPDGLWVIQMTDLVSMLKSNAFDNIVHEHLEYYSLVSLSKLLSEYRMFIWDIEYNDVNGGSIRVYVKKNLGYTDRINTSVFTSYDKELQYFNENLSVTDALKNFHTRINAIRSAITSFIREEVGRGKIVAGLGASTKGNTLLQYFGLTNKDIEFIAEVNSDKYGLETIGSRIPMIPQNVALDKTPDYFLVLPWHFLSTFTKNLWPYLVNGGKFIVPCPNPVVMGLTGVELKLWK